MYKGEWMPKWDSTLFEPSSWQQSEGKFFCASIWSYAWKSKKIPLFLSLTSKSCICFESFYKSYSPCLPNKDLHLKILPWANDFFLFPRSPDIKTFVCKKESLTSQGQIKIIGKLTLKHVGRWCSIYSIFLLEIFLSSIFYPLPEFFWWTSW